MASFLDYFVFNTPDSTPLSVLRINDSISKLQIESQQYFTIPPGALAAESDQLAVFIKRPFNLNNPNHKDYMRRCTTNYSEKAQALYELDHKIKLSLLVMVVAYSLSFFPFIGWLTMAGMFAALYFSVQRGSLFAEQQESLKLLVGVCNWSIGPGVSATMDMGKNKVQPLRQNTKDELLKCEEIQAMMDQLTILDDNQTAHFLADDIQKHFLDLLEAYDNSFTFFGKRNDAALAKRAQIPELEQIALKRRGSEFNRCIYGLNKGQTKDFIDAFLSALPDLWQAAKSACKACVTPAPVASPV